MPEKQLWFKYVLMASFFVTVALEMYGVWTHNYTLSDWILENIRMKWRVVVLAWLVFHFLFAYPTYR